MEGDELESLLQNARSHQNATLLEVLENNIECEYLRSHGLHVCDKKMFKDVIPLCDYEYVSDYIQRMAMRQVNDPPLLFCSPVLSFCISSGTTGGVPKIFPLNSYFFNLGNEAGRYCEIITKRQRDEEFARRNISVDDPKISSFSVAGKQTQTGGGHTRAPGLTLYQRGNIFRDAYPTFGYCSPIDVVLAEDPAQALYCHVLCGLLNSQKVWCLDAGFAFHVDSAINVLKNSWQLLCEDIRKGVLNQKISHEHLRKAMQEHLRADPELAKEVEKQCCAKSWKGIITRLWPNATMIRCRASGPTMKPYRSRINYYSENLPIYGHSYATSEGGVLAIATKVPCSPDEETDYTLLPNVAYFEFIPLKLMQANPEEEAQETCVGGSSFEYLFSEDDLKPVEIDQVQIGSFYQPVVTSFQGLYRYKIEDVIKITGFHGESPTFEFVCRKNVLPGVNVEKIDESEIQMIVLKASDYLQSHGLKVSDYTSTVDMASTPGHYVIFMEIEKFLQKLESDHYKYDAVMRTSCSSMDGSLNYMYKMLRKSGLIGALEVCVVQPGTFSELLKQRLQGGACIDQYKPARTLTCSSEPVTHILKPRTVKSFVSNNDMSEVQVYI